jgi:release factor H-coupled RctB family protein
VVLVHSGSRALGSALAARHAGRELRGSDITAYLADLRGAIRYARTNRLLVAMRLLRAAGLGSIGRVAALVDLVHNAVEARADGSYLHRKGAAPARRDEPTVVLGSRGSPSWVMQGLGSEASLCCVAHGAGRRMARSEALAKLKQRHTRASLARSPLGTRVLCDDTTLMYEEHPDAYKPIEPVVASLEAAGAARRVAALVPLITVKK